MNETPISYWESVALTAWQRHVTQQQDDLNISATRSLLEAGERMLAEWAQAERMRSRRHQR